MEALFEQASALTAGQRGHFLDVSCADDGPLREEVQAMVAAAAPHRALGIERLAPAGLAPEATPDPLLGKAVGPWHLRRVLGRGGMGTVYLAERADGQYQQRAALKLVHPGLARPEAVERFRTERQVLAHLQHPNIARLLDGGFACDGRPYFVMELVEGASITDSCRSRNLSLDDRLRLFRLVCDAVQHAHAARVVHRDLKPANIFVSVRGEVKLLDFGIAKVLEPAALGVEAPATRAEATPLTPEYAAPEQLLGEPITTATDVYALGVVLYELLTGTRPVALAGKTPRQVQREVSEARIVPPSARLGRRRGDDLDSIVLTALQAQSARRYATAGHLGAEIGRLLEDRPVLARPDTLRYRTRRFLSRNRGAVAAVLAIAVTAGGFGGLARWQAERAAAHSDLAQLERDRADEMTQLFGPGLTSEIESLIAAGRHAQAERSLRAAFAQHERLFGADHWRTTRTAHGMGRLLGIQQRYAEALTWFDRAMAFPDRTRERALRFARGQRALMLLRLGQAEEAVTALRTQERELVTIGAPDGPRGVLTFVRLWLARALTESDRAAEAEGPARLALAGFDGLGRRNPQRLEAGCELGRALVRSGRREEGRSLLEQCLPAYRAWPRADPLLVGAVERLLATRQGRRGSGHPLATGGAAEHGLERVEAERFFQQQAVALLDQGAGAGGEGAAGHEDDARAERGDQADDPVGQLCPRHVRHRQIAQDHVEDAAGQQGHHLRRGAGHGHLVGRLEQALEGAQDRCLVVDGQDAQGWQVGRGGVAAFFDPDGVGRGQQDAEHAALALHRIEGDVASGGGDDGPGDGQAQAGTGAGGLGGEERIEHARLGRVGDAAAGVGDPDLHPGVGRGADADPDGVLVRPPLVDGVDGVHDQVHQDLLQPDPVDLHGGGLGELRLQPGAVPDLVGGQPQNRLDHRPDIDDGGLLGSRAAHLLDLANDAGDAARALDGLLDQGGQLRVAVPQGDRQLPGGQLEIGDNVTEGVVDLVGDTGGQRAQGGHPLGVGGPLGDGLGDHPLDGRQQDRDVQGLGDEGGGVHCPGLGRPVGRQGDDRYLGQQRVALLLQPELPAVHHRHHQIQQHHIRRLPPPQPGQGRSPVRGGRDLEPLQGQKVGQGGPDVMVVLDDEDRPPAPAQIEAPLGRPSRHGRGGGRRSRLQ
jgi:tRNA A-37 threonylcarbamoyl transferase component Bud32